MSIFRHTAAVETLRVTYAHHCLGLTEAICGPAAGSEGSASWSELAAAWPLCTRAGRPAAGQCPRVLTGVAQTLQHALAVIGEYAEGVSSFS